MPTMASRLRGATVTAKPTIDVVAAGVVRLSSPHSHWMIDLTERRFCRSATPVNRRFVAPDEWTGIRDDLGNARGRLDPHGHRLDHLTSDTLDRSRLTQRVSAT